MGSLVREDGHIYSLASSGNLLYTGSDSKNIRVWKKQKEFSGFKSNSGLVKSIVISGGGRIFKCHQDGKIRVWKASSKEATVRKRIGTLPTLRAVIKSSMTGAWIKHLDAISSQSLSDDDTILYSESWDRTVKGWRVSNFKFLESISAHDDAVNAVVSGFDGLLFTGSADGTVKVWRREIQISTTVLLPDQQVGDLRRQSAPGTGGKVTPGTYGERDEAFLFPNAAKTRMFGDRVGRGSGAATMLYCGSSDGAVYFWERGKFSSMSGQLGAHKLAVLCLSTADNLVLSGSADMNICIWKRAESGLNGHVFLSMLTGHNGPIKCLAVERDEEAGSGEPRWTIYNGSLDKSVKIWQISEQVIPVEQFASVEDPNVCW